MSDWQRQVPQANTGVGREERWTSNWNRTQRSQDSQPWVQTETDDQRNWFGSGEKWSMWMKSLVFFSNFPPLNLEGLCLYYWLLFFSYFIMIFPPQSLPRDITPLIIAQYFGQPDANTGGPSEDSGEDTVDDQEPKLQRRCNLKGRVSTNLKPVFKNVFKSLIVHLCSRIIPHPNACHSHLLD